MKTKFNEFNENKEQPSENQNYLDKVIGLSCFKYNNSTYRLQSFMYKYELTDDICVL